jgi:hypothetical protein
MGGKLAGDSGGRCAVPRRVPAALSRRTGLSNIPPGLLTGLGVAVCVVNLGIYALRYQHGIW